jgi:hypothetical protein
VSHVGSLRSKRCSRLTTILILLLKSYSLVLVHLFLVCLVSIVVLLTKTLPPTKGLDLEVSIHPIDPTRG